MPAGLGWASLCLGDGTSTSCSSSFPVSAPLLKSSEHIPHCSEALPLTSGPPGLSLCPKHLPRGFLKLKPKRERQKAGMKARMRVSRAARPGTGRRRRAGGNLERSLPPAGLPQGAPDLGHLGQWPRCGLPALLPARGGCGGLHTGGVSRGCSRWVPEGWGWGRAFD